MFGADGVWGEWARRWTAEEGRHSIVIRDYLTVTRPIDPWRSSGPACTGERRGPSPSRRRAGDGFVYVALQELATRIAHRNTGKLLDDRVGYDVMARVAADENLHYLFYRDLRDGRHRGGPVRHDDRHRAPGARVRDAGHRHPRLRRPRRRHRQGRASTTCILHHEQILVPVVLRHWGIGAVEGLTPRRSRPATRSSPASTGSVAPAAVSPIAGSGASIPAGYRNWAESGLGQQPTVVRH